MDACRRFRMMRAHVVFETERMADIGGLHGRGRALVRCYHTEQTFKQKRKIMGKHYLSTLFSPKSVAVFGASDRVDSVGQIVFKNMLESGFKGALYPININSPEVQGKRAYAAITDIGEPVELVVIATQPKTVPGII